MSRIAVAFRSERIVSNSDTTVVSNRKKAIKSRTAKLSDVKHILKVAAEHCDELRALWEEHHE